LRSPYISRKTFLKATLVALALSLAPVEKAFAELVVIVNKNNPTASIRATDLRLIYNGGKRMFENGTVIQPANLQPENEVRNDFFSRVLHLDAESYRLYWVRMIFSGKGKPPVEFENEEEAVNFVATNKGGLAFVDSSSVDSSIKAVKINLDE
jgi:ABC-type phosphate transport system substrate-binding protein